MQRQNQSKKDVIMKLAKLAMSSVAALAIAATFTACGGTTPAADSTETLSGTISANKTLDATKKYKISGKVVVSTGVTLTIPAGTVLYGATTTSWLEVLPGALLMAQGTEAKPVIFTSAAEVAGLSSGTGQWGGVTILGSAPTNKSGFTYEVDATAAGTADGTGGTTNSGTLSYVIVKNTGFEVETDKELNGLSLVAVGSGTTIDHVASINSKDDCIEIWGGTVNPSNVYIYNCADDGYDMDNGFVGTTNGLYIKMFAAGSTDPRAIEADSYSSTDGNGTSSPEYRSAPTITNFFIDYNDGEYLQAIYLREGIRATFSHGQIYAKGASALVVVNVDDNTSAGTTVGTWTDVNVTSAGKLLTYIDEAVTSDTNASISGVTIYKTTTAPSIADSNVSALKTWGDKYIVDNMFN